MRDDRNAGKRTGYPQWMVWAAREQISGEQIVMVEEVLDDAELATIPEHAPSAVDEANAIAAAMQTQKVRL